MRDLQVEDSRTAEGNFGQLLPFYFGTSVGGYKMFSSSYEDVLLIFLINFLNSSINEINSSEQVFKKRME